MVRVLGDAGPGAGAGVAGFASVGLASTGLDSAGFSAGLTSTMTAGTVIVTTLSMPVMSANERSMRATDDLPVPAEFFGVMVKTYKASGSRPESIEDFAAELLRVVVPAISAVTVLPEPPAGFAVITYVTPAPPFVLVDLCDQSSFTVLFFDVVRTTRSVAEPTALTGVPEPMILPS